MFTQEGWEGSGFLALGLKFEYSSLVAARQLLRQHAVGWCPGEELQFRQKENQVGVACERDADAFWFHLRNNEFYEVFCR
jgi:hypothetical protein